MLQLGTGRDSMWAADGGTCMKRSGFTTIEMVIVVVLIGIIDAIGFPKIRQSLDKANVRSARAAGGGGGAWAARAPPPPPPPPPHTRGGGKQKPPPQK